MAPTQPYLGQPFMAQSKYASPRFKAEMERILSQNPDFKAKTEADKIIATRGQVAAADKAQRSSDSKVQLAEAQSRAIAEEVAQHTAKVSRSISAAVTNTRQILNLVRDVMKKENPDSAEANLKTVDNLWQELEKLIGVTHEAKDALPHYLEKQKEHIGFAAASKVQEAYLETQQELNLQNKKVNLQHEVILGQQQAFKDHEASAQSKIQENNELQERLSRVVLEKGVLRTELDKAKEQLAQVQAVNEAASKTIEELKKEVSVLAASKDSLAGESLELRNGVDDLQAKLNAAEQKATDHYEKDIRRVNEELQKEKEKAVALDTHLKPLRKSDVNAQKETEKAKTDLKLMTEKYNSQSSEYGKVVEDLNRQKKKAAALSTELERLQKQKVDLEQERTGLADVKDNLQKQLDTLNTELGRAKQENADAKEQADRLSTKLKQVEKENDELETENNELLAKQTDHKKAVNALNSAKAENAALLATMQDLRNKSTVTNSSAVEESVKIELQELKDKYAKVESDRAGWEEIARKSLAEYKSILPTYKVAESIQEENRALKAAARRSTGQSNGTVGGDAAYWKKKYDNLLATMD